MSAKVKVVRTIKDSVYQDMDSGEDSYEVFFAIFMRVEKMVNDQLVWTIEEAIDEKQVG